MAKIQPGLERIAGLLRNVNFPWKAIHVAGTNGKGSICHHASSLITGRNIRVGKFTSPHLVDRWDCISIDGKPVDENTFLTVEQHFRLVNASRQIGASPFEILTATAFTIFNDANVEIGLVEVGMGGKLDSTNILNNQAVSVISKIARDHEGFLGNTLSKIAAHKAGILRPNVPYIINPSNEENVQNVIQDYARDIEAGPRLYPDSFDLQRNLYTLSKWGRITRTMMPFQQENLKMAVVAVMQTLESMHHPVKPLDLSKTLLANMKTHHHGRQEMIQVPPVFRNPTQRKNMILVDGAHNPDAAKALDGFIQDNMRFGQAPSKYRPASGWPVTWVLAMTEGKDARQYLATLLKPGDNVVTTTFGHVDGMPWVKPMDPKELLDVAKSVEPHITGVHMPVPGPIRALCAAKYLSNQLADWAPIVLTGSLYLVGDFHRELRPRSSKNWWTDTDAATAADRERILQIQAEERNRVNAVLGPIDKLPVGEAVGATKSGDSETEEQKRLQEEIDALNREVEGLEIEEGRLEKTRSVEIDTPVTTGALPSTSQGEQELDPVQRFELEEKSFIGLHSTPEQIAESIAKAEKRKKDLAREAERMEEAAKVRQEKADQKAKAKERLLRKREARAERKKLQLTKEQWWKQKRAAVDSGEPIRWSMHRTAQPSSDAEPHDALSSPTIRKSNAGSSPSRSNDVEPRDALSILSKKPPSNRPASQTARPQDTDIKPSFLTTPITRNRPAEPTPAPAPKRKPAKPTSRNAKPAPKIHMHYANTAYPGKAKMRTFPIAGRMGAWHIKDPRPRVNPISYYDPEGPDGRRD